MGNYSKNISKRFEHTKITQGYCLICGNFGSLSWDHVPPKGSIKVTKVEQLHITEVMGMTPSNIKGVASPNGSKFKTICKSCNESHLGCGDDEVARVCKSLTDKVLDYFYQANYPSTLISEKVNAMKYARSMVGHILSATTVKECMRVPSPSDYFDPLKQFVLGDDQAMDETHDIYYWFYPFGRHVSAKYISFYNEGHIASVSLLSFFPISFMLTKKNEGTYPAHAKMLSLSDDRLWLDLSSRGYEYCEFPFHSLKGNQMMALHDSRAIVSHSIGQ